MRLNFTTAAQKLTALGGFGMSFRAFREYLTLEERGLLAELLDHGKSVERMNPELLAEDGSFVVTSGTVRKWGVAEQCFLGVIAGLQKKGVLTMREVTAGGGKGGFRKRRWVKVNFEELLHHAERVAY